MSQKKKATRKRQYIRPASLAAKASKKSQAEFSFHREVSREPIYIERVLVGLVNYIEEVSPPPGGQIIVDDLIEHIKTQAENYGETLAKRATQYINTALSRLRKNHYIIFPYRRNDIVRIKISPQLKAIMSRLVTEASAAGFENLANLSLREHRILGAYFRSRIKVRPAMTRRELDLQNAALEYRLEQHKMICPLEQSQPPADEVPEPQGMRFASQENRALDGAHFTDSTYMDDVPADGPSNTTLLQTPPRKSQSMTLNNPEAYPSPQSPPHRMGSRSIPRTRTPTPPRSFRMPGTLDEEPRRDGDMDIDFPPPPSPVSTEPLSTADDLTVSNDFRDLGAITATQRMLNASLIEVETLRSKIQELNTEIEDLKENLEAERKHGLLMKFANIFLRAADQARLQEATRKKEEYQGKLRAICGISTGI